MTKQQQKQAEKEYAETRNTQADENNCDIEQSRKDLSDLYKNVTMAQNCVKTLLPYVEEQEITKTTPAPKMFVTMANMGIRAKMISDKSVTHIAKVMLQGTLNGIIDLYRMTRNSQNTHPEVALLSKQILRYEEGCFETMKGML